MAWLKRRLGKAAPVRAQAFARTGRGAFEPMGSYEPCMGSAVKDWPNWTPDQVVAGSDAGLFWSAFGAGRRRKGIARRLGWPYEIARSRPAGHAVAAFHAFKSDHRIKRSGQRTTPAVQK